VFLGLESEGVNIDTSDRDISVVLVRLDKIEVRAESFLESVVTIKLELSTDGWVSTGIDGAETSVISVISSSGKSTEVSRSKVACVRTRASWAGKTKRSDLSVSLTKSSTRTGSTNGTDTSSILLKTSVVGEELSVFRVNITKANEWEDISVTFNISEDKLRRISNAVSAETSISIVVISVVIPLVETSLDNIVSLDNPDELLARVVEIQLNLDVSVDGRFVTSELELINEVFVRSLSESASFVSVEVDVVNEESSILEGRNTESIIAGSCASTASSGDRSGNIAFTLGSELKVELDFVVLKSNKRKSKTRVSAEPELKGNIEGSCVGSGKTSSGKSNSVTNHVIVTRSEASRNSKFIPDSEPVTVVLVDCDHQFQLRPA